MSGPVEAKVSAATIASAVSGLGLWALQVYVFHGEVPLPVVAATMTVVPAIVTFAAGWLAPHTPRPDLQVDPVDVAAACGEPTPSGRHALDDDPDDRPVSSFQRHPSATRFRHPQD